MDASVFVISLDIIIEQNIKLGRLTLNDQQFGCQHDPNAILNKCCKIDKGIDIIKRNLNTICKLQQHALADPNSS